MTATTTNETTAPMKRAKTSKVWPIRPKSLVKLASDLAGGHLAGEGGSGAADGAVGDDARAEGATSQFCTANQCRPLPVAAETRPSPTTARRPGDEGRDVARDDAGVDGAADRPRG